MHLTTEQILSLLDRVAEAENIPVAENVIAVLLAEEDSPLKQTLIVAIGDGMKVSLG